ncbi:unnamed protein product, partial [marine sediment metagenome]
IEVKWCGICGSDVHAVPEAILYPPGTYLGHEFSGVLAKVGKNVEGWKVGDRVTANPMYMCGKCEACRRGRESICEHGFEHAIAAAPGREHAGAFAKYIRIPLPEKRLHLLPDEVSFEEGALVEPLSVSLHAVRMSSLKPRQHTLVLGTGTIGLGVIAHLRNAGAGLIIATETIPKRIEVARKLGADYVFNPSEISDLKEKVFQLTSGKGVDIVFDCSGTPQAFRTATDFLKRGGEIVLVGV